MATRRRPKGEGSIFQRADGRWIGKLLYEDPVTGLLKRAQVSGVTKSAVSAEIKKIRERLATGGPPRDDKALYGDFAQQWVDTTLAASDRKHSTKTLYEGLTKSHIIGSDLGKTPMNRVRPTTVERFITQLRAKGLADSTVRQIYTIARAIGDAAVRDGLIGKNPFTAIRRPQVSQTEATFLTPPQITVLLANAKESRYAPLFTFLVNTGLRRGEALALKWADVDLTERLARVRGTLARIDGELVVTDTKSEKSRRTIPLSEPAIEVLTTLKRRTAAERHRAGSLWVGSGFVFVTEFGDACDPRNALRALTVAAKRAGLAGVGLHTLRHSAASVMLSNGVPITVVSQILGHSGISITVDVYGHVSPDVSRGALDVLAGALNMKSES